ncbi:MAG: PQQ-binding-like beta-propeller repeat protein [Myxococcales bacterium]|nr:PQQ-binding-like beta-propeller repeat protein [Myxococcales bacterium]
MARLVKAACPNCGAGVSLDPTRDVVSCTFCGTSSFVQRPRRAPTAPTPVVPQGMPTIVVSDDHVRNPAPILVGVAVMALVVGGGMFALLSTETRASGGGRYSVGGRPLPLDANGDGVADIAMQLTTLQDKSTEHLAAFDPASGKQLWRTDALAKTPEHVAAVKDRLVAAVGAQLLGFDARTGQRAFATALPELPDALCDHQTGLAVLTKDKKLYPVDLGSGALGAPTAGARYYQEPGTRCIDLDPPHRSQGPRLFELNEGPYRERAKGMQVSDVYALGDSKQALVVGTRQPGTRVPMVAMFDGDRQLWMQEVPGSEPLAAKEGDPTAIGFGSGRVLVAYERSDKEELHLVCIEAMSGKRAWEVAFPERAFFTSFGITDRYVVMSGFGKARSLALADGRQLAVISGH